jgi:hypothetical protein
LRNIQKYSEISFDADSFKKLPKDQRSKIRQQWQMEEANKIEQEQQAAIIAPAALAEIDEHGEADEDSPEVAEEVNQTIAPTVLKAKDPEPAEDVHLTVRQGVTGK